MKNNNKNKAGAIVLTLVLVFVGFMPIVNSQLKTNEINNNLQNSLDKLSKKSIFSNIITFEGENWWNNNWPYRMLITIDHNEVAADLTNFPVSIYISSDSDLAKHAQNDADDITFIQYADNTTQLNHEIEFFNSSSGELVAWVNVTSLSSTIDTKIWMYYGNSGSGNQENIEGTWDANYIMVQHLNEASGTLFDSTSNNNDGTNNGSTFTSAKLDGSYDFDGLDDDIDVGTFDVIGDGLTLSMWFKADDFGETLCTSGLRLISKATGPETVNHFWMLAVGDNGDKFRFRLRTGTVQNLISNSVSMNADEWYYAVASYDGSSMRIFLNGNEEGSRSVSGNVAVDDTVPVWIGANPPNHYRAWDGIIDEMRVSNIGRDSNWIQTSFNNQNNSEGFFSVSEEELCQFNLTINIDGNGAVTKDPDQTTYDYGTLVELTAVADPGWTFDHWSGDLTGSDNPETINMTSDKEVTAHFTEDEYTLTINIEGMGTVTKDPNQSTYTYGTLVELTAKANIGWTFDHWSGDLTGSDNPETINMTSNKEVTAHFTEDQYTLTINLDGNGDVTKDPDNTTYTYGTLVDLTAVADPGWTFDHWSGDLNGSENPETINMTDDKEVTAHFTQDKYILTVNIEGNGIVEIDPNQENYTYGTLVELTAIPDSGWDFSYWSGDLTGSENPATINMTGDMTVTAHFTENEYTLTIEVVGSGSVTKDPNQNTYPPGTVVTLTAVADTGWMFSHWTGDLSGSNNPDTITMDSNKVVTAHFEEDKINPNVKIIKPENAIYVLNNQLVSFKFPVIFIGINMIVDAYDNETGIEKVEFYLDGEKQSTDKEAPYEWMWRDQSTRMHTITVTAYDHAGNTDSDEIEVWKWKFHPALILLFFVIGLIWSYFG